MKYCLLKWFSIFCLIAGSSLEVFSHGYFQIKVVDEETGRGVPLVELKTVNQIRYYTDSNGIVAFYEPGLMGQEVFFSLSSHGYQYPKDGFGNRGVRLRPQENQEAVIKLKRANIAERLYRITGGGIYRNSVLTGESVPIKEPLLNGQVLGQDSAFAVPFNGAIYWFWGDTNRPQYPLGNFMTSGATAPIPSPPRVSPEQGINLNYFVNEKGFSKSMAPIKQSGLIWLDGLMTLPTAEGKEQMAAHYRHMESLGEQLEHGLVLYDTKIEEFKHYTQFDLEKSWQCPQAHPIEADESNDGYIYFPTPFPNVRVKADWEAVQDQSNYEAFTCLQAGESYQGANSKFDRDDGELHYLWKPNTDPIGPKQEQELIEAGLLQKENARFLPTDIEGNETVIMHTGSVHWNDFREKWILICVQFGGSSFLGEVWYAESDSLTGPWKTAQKIVSHDKYSFYNPVHHPFFDQQNGQIIYFEGTYTKMFSKTKVATPRYDYNQILYRLDLNKLDFSRLDN